MKFLINREIIISIIKIKKFHSSLTYIKAKNRNSFASSFKNNKNLKKTNAKKRIETRSMKFSNKFHSSSWKTFHVSFYFLLQKNIKTKKKTKNNFEKTNLQINLAVTLITENKTIKTMFTKPSNKFHPSSAYRNRNRSTQSPVAFLQKKEIKNRYVFLRAISVSERGFLPSLSKEPGDLQMGSLNIAHGKQAHPSCLS